MGVWIGIGLVILATACALLIAGKAAQSVAQFRHEDHEAFIGHEQAEAPAKQKG